MRTQDSENFHSKGSDPYISSGTCGEDMQGEEVRKSCILHLNSLYINLEKIDQIRLIFHISFFSHCLFSACFTNFLIVKNMVFYSTLYPRTIFSTLLNFFLIHFSFSKKSKSLYVYRSSYL